jgi:tetratricopeptide (TPR) repeat protein/tRNA A-37 threonylcarbamoyl transferase component Bud32
LIEPEQDKVVGTVVAGRFEVLRVLGQGGMGTVYEARQVAMNRRVALKLIHAHVVQSQAGIERFEREMQATARIRHPNTIQVYDYGRTEDGRLYLAMEFLEGRSLADVIRDEGPLSFERVVHIGTQVARALHAAQSEGIVHRDLKPDNIMLIDRYGERDQLQVLDFGIAHFLDNSHTQLTTDGAIIGTPAYMAPEQAKGVGVDARTDLYALGVVLYEMVTGSAPFRGPTTVSVLVMHVQVPPRPPSELVAVPEGLEALIMALLAKAPDDRPKSAAEVVERLRALAPEAAGTTGPRRPPPDLGSGPVLDPRAQDAPTDIGAHPSGPARPSAGSGGARPGAGGAGHEPAHGGGGVWVAMSLILGGITLVIGLIAGIAWWAMGGGQTPDLPDAPDVAALLADADARGGGGGEEDAGRPRAKPDAGAKAPPVAPEPPADKDVEAAPPDAPAPADAGGAAVDEVASAPADGGAQAASDTGAPPPELPEATAEARAALDALYAESSDPPPPVSCRASDAALVARLTQAATLLKDGVVGGGRADDQRALALLEEGASAADPAADAPGGAELQALLARARFLVGVEPAKALDAARAADKACPDWALPKNLIGNGLQLTRDFPAATAAYERALVAWPSYAAPRFNVGLLAMRAGDHEAAVAAFTGLLERNPEHPNAHLARAQANLARKKPEAALPDLEIATERRPDHGGAWLLRGQTLKLLGKAEEAQKAFCRAKELGEDSAKGLWP